MSHEVSPLIKLLLRGSELLGNVWTRLCQSGTENDMWVTLFVCLRGEVMQRRARRLKNKAELQIKEDGRFAQMSRPASLTDELLQWRSREKRLKSLSVWCHSSGVTHVLTHTFRCVSKWRQCWHLCVQKPKLLGDGEHAPPAACLRKRPCVVDLRFMTQT